MKTPLNQLWGARVSAVEVASDFSALSLVLGVTDSASLPAEQTHRLELKGISMLQFRRSAPLPWNYSELTSIAARAVPEGVEVVAELWDSENTLHIVCSGCSLDGDALQVAHNNAFKGRRAKRARPYRER
jgi:hypothetical protein